MKKFSQYMIPALLLVSAVLGMVPAQAVELVTYYHNDPLGSPLVASDEYGNELWTERYRPFGDRIVQDAKAGDNQMWYTGKPQDSATGLSYYGARYYDPVLGRFMGIDPVGFQDGNLHSFNRYAYANNNPYKFVDPDGRAAETVLDVVSLSLSIAAYRSDPSFVNGLGVAYDGFATVVPFLPGGFGIIKNASNGIDAAGDISKNVLKNGDALKTNDALDAALEHLGPGYREIAPGVFKSADGTKIVRMTDSDLARTGNHAGAPHLNFETGETVVKPNGKERFISKDNKHIFLPEEK